MSEQTAQTPPAPGAKGYWRWLYHQMLAAMADGSFMRFDGYTVPNRTFQYRSLQEFRTQLEWVESKANLEEGARPYHRRTFAGQKGWR